MRRAFSPIGWATFLVTLGSSLVGVLSNPVTRPGSAIGGAAVAGVAAGLASVVVADAWARRLGEPSTLVGRSGQVGAAMLVGTVLHARLLEWLGLGVRMLDTFPLVTLAATGFALGAWWIVDGLSRDWRRAAVARERLTRAFAEASDLNVLLARAERERFDLQARSIVLRVEEPLGRLTAAAPTLSPRALATELERLVDDVMRPLAHVMHPVAVRTGLVPAVRALGSTYRLSVPAELAAADAAGTLLADDVRLQVYRWIRHLEPAVSGGVIELSLARPGGPDEPGLLVEVSGAREGSLEVDPIGSVAGLRSDGRRLRAPLLEAGAAIAPWSAPDDDGRAAAAPRRRLPSWRLLANPPEMNVAFVALISAVTTPVRFYPVPVAVGPESVGALVLSGAAPIVVAVLLRRAPAPGGAVARAAWSIVAWILVGLAAGLASWMAAGFVVPDAPGQGLVVQIARGLVRHVPTGIAYQLARGAAAQAQADGATLEAALADAHARRSRLLARVEAVERYASEALHRTAQGRLTAAAALARIGREPEALREVEHVRLVTIPAIVERLSSVDLEADAPAIEPAAAGIVREDRIDWAEVGATYPALASALRRVIDECAVNAQRHGGAQRIEIGLTEEGGSLRLECRDDGAGLAAGGPATAGLGSRLFDEMCARFDGRWELGPRQDGLAGARFVLTVPVADASTTPG